MIHVKNVHFVPTINSCIVNQSFDQNPVSSEIYPTANPTSRSYFSCLSVMEVMNTILLQIVASQRYGQSHITIVGARGDMLPAGKWKSRGEQTTP